MAYTIHKADGTLISIPDNTIDVDFYNSTGGSSGGVSPGIGQGFRFIGRNTLDYGTAIAQNFLQITENFSSITGTQPLGQYALQGQLWFDKTLGTMFVRSTPGVLGADDMTNWQQILTGSPSGTDITGNLTTTGTVDVGTNLTVTGSGEIGTDLTVHGSEFVDNNLTVNGSITSGGHHVPVVYTSLPATALAGDMLVVGSVISLYANGAWRQVFPALYS